MSLRVLASWVAIAIAACVSPFEARADVPPTPSAPTTGARPLGLEEVLSGVERAFPLLQAAEIDRSIAEADVLSAEGGFDLAWRSRATGMPLGYYRSIRVDSTIEKPTTLWGATGFAGYRLGRGDFADYDGKAETLEYGEVRAGLHVPLWRNGPIDRRRASLARAELGREVAALGVAQQRIEVRRAAGLRYWAWVAAGRRLKIARDLLDIAEKRDAVVAARVETGDVAAVELLDNRRAIEQRRAQLTQAVRGLEQAALELSLYLRGPDGSPTIPSADRLPPDFPVTDVPAGAGPEEARAALARRPEARRLAMQAEQAQVELDWAENQRALGIDLQVAGSVDLGPSASDRPDLARPVLEATLLLDVPLQTRVADGRADAARALMRRLGHQQAFAAERIRTDVNDARSALRASRDRIVAAVQEARLAHALESGEREKFDAGDSNLLFVNLREQQSAEAELRVVDARLELARAEVELRAARGE